MGYFHELVVDVIHKGRKVSFFPMILPPILSTFWFYIRVICYNSFVVCTPLGLYPHGTLFRLPGDAVGQGHDHCQGLGEVGPGIQLL